jgi:hypothetical protein
MGKRGRGWIVSDDKRLGPTDADKARWAAENAPILEGIIEAAYRKFNSPTVEPRKKFVHIGAPACFALELAVQPICKAFNSFGVYVVGSALDRADWRDVDLRMIMADDDFDKEFPGTRENGTWEFDPKWLLLTVAISEHLKKLTGLPVDFQFQPQTHANARHNGPRNAIGLRIAP